MEPLTTDLEMQDIIGRMYFKLQDEGYRGDYHDTKTEEFENQIHATHAAVMNRKAHLQHFKRICVDFYLYYQKKAPLRDIEAEWLKRMEGE